MTANLFIFFGGIVVGMLILAIIKKQKMNRRFDIENQMLRDQAEILRLQKKLSDIESEKKQLLSYVETSKLNKNAALRSVAS